MGFTLHTTYKLQNSIRPPIPLSCTKPNRANAARSTLGTKKQRGKSRDFPLY